MKELKKSLGTPDLEFNLHRVVGSPFNGESNGAVARPREADLGCRDREGQQVDEHLLPKPRAESWQGETY